MKRGLRTTIFLFAVLLSILLSETSVMAATSGDYSYAIFGEGIVITAYNGTSNVVSIPATINGKQVIGIGESAFAGKLCIEKLTIPSSVTRIDDYAFETCGRLKTINFPSKLKSIGYGAFSGCGNLTNISLPQGLEKIEACAFYCCNSLNRLSLPSSVNAIGYSAFSGCELTELSIPNDTQLTSIENRAFYRCNIESIVIPSKIIKLGKESFALNNQLHSVSIEGVEEIGEGCFKTNQSDPENPIGLSVSARVIGKEAFSGLELESLTIEEGVESIGKEAFAYSVDTLEIPSTVNNIEDGAFASCYVSSFAFPNGSEYYEFEGGGLYSKNSAKLVAVPQKHSGSFNIKEGTKEIGAYAFSGVTGITNLSIPNSVNTIGAYAFKNFIIYEPEGDSIALEIPSSVTSIGEGAFMDMVIVPLMDEDILKEVGTLKINANINTISINMFKNQVGNSSEPYNLILPDTVTTIQENAFYGSMVNVTIPSAIETVANGAFLYSRGTILAAPGGHISIKDNNYIVKNGTELVGFVSQGADLSEITELTIPSGITTINPFAIVLTNDNSKSRIINVPQSVTTVGKYGIGFNNAKAEIYNYNLKFPDNNVVIYTESNSVMDYARTNAISCFTSTPSQNIESVTLAGDETANFVINNARKGDVAYTSGDKSIATVNQNGTITAQRKGKVYIVATVGHANYKCAVTVTSDSSNPVENDFDESKYHDVQGCEYDSWLTEYVKYNDGNIPANYKECVYIERYKMDFPTYYKAINSVECNDPLYLSRVQNEFGLGFEETSRIMSRGLARELGNYCCNENLVLYTGTKEIDIITGITPNIPDMISLIGNTYNVPLSTSTTLDEDIACHFGDYIAIIYADKEAINGGYIETVSAVTSGGEYEMLLAPGYKLTVLDAGVRYINIKSMDAEEEDEGEYVYERYIKYHLSKDNNPPSTNPNKNVDTSDANVIELYLLLMVLSLVGCIATLKRLV